MAYDNTDSGSLFKNDRKTKDTHPNATGSAEITCPHCGQIGLFWLSAWTKTIKQGKRMGGMMQSLAFTEKDEQPSERHNEEARRTAGGKSAPAPPHGDDFDDDVPFD
jgi:hypothetical protein